MMTDDDDNDNNTQTKFEACEDLFRKLEQFWVECKIITPHEYKVIRQEYPTTVEEKVAAFEKYLIPPIKAGQLVQYLKDEVTTIQTLAAMLDPKKLKKHNIDADAVIKRIKDGVLKNERLLRGTKFYCDHIANSLLG